MTWAPFRSRSCVLLGILLCLGTSGLSAREHLPRQPSSLSATERAAVFSWFDQLPLPDVRRCKCVRIWTGAYSIPESGPAEFETNTGFLLSDNGREFHAVLRDFTTASFDKAGRKPGEKEFVGYHVISLEREIRSLLPKIGTAADTESNQSWSYLEFLDRASQLFALARVCAGHGDTKLAQALIGRVNATRRSISRCREDLPLAAILQDNFADLLVFEATRSFRSQGVAREALYRRFHDILHWCPKAGYSLESAGATCAILERMLQEDARHRAASDADLAALPAAQRATELVFRLRDETAKSLDMWPYPDLRDLMPSNGAYASLVGLNLDAVPALLPALDDDSLSRSISASVGGFGPRCRSMPVKELAMAALEDIAGFRFACLAKDGGGDGWEKARADAVRAWWKQVGEIGEKPYLVAKVREDGEHAEDFASALLQKFPEAGLLELTGLAPALKEPRNRAAVTRLLWNHDTPECHAFLATEVHAGPSLGNRAAAAFGLRALHDPAGMDAMLVEWKKIMATDPALLPPTLQSDDTPDSPIHVVQFLLSSTGPEAILTVGESLPHLPLWWQVSILHSLDQSALGAATSPAEPLSPAGRLAIEDVLLDRLDDLTAISKDVVGQVGLPPRLPVHLRICDLAGVMLHDLLPARYPFQAGLSPAARYRQCVQFHNLRLAALGEPLLPLPAEERIKVLPATEVNKVVSVACETGSAPLPPGLNARLNALKGKNLTSKLLLGLLRAFAQLRPDGEGGIKITVTRYGDRAGVCVTTNVSAGNPPAPAHRYCTAYCLANGRSSFSTAGDHDEMGPNKWREFVASLDAALASDPANAFEISAGLSTE